MTDQLPRQSTDALLAVLRTGVTVYDLGRTLYNGVPQSSQHPPYQLVTPRRHGDLVRPDGSSAANDLLVTGTHVGTHIDALSHISFEGCLHGGVDALAAQSQFGFSVLGIETAPPLVARAVLLDIPRTLGIECCAAAYEVTVADLEAAADLAGARPAPGDVVLVRTGWGQHFDDAMMFTGEVAGAPGVGESGARWLAEHAPIAVGSDTVAFDWIPASNPEYVLSAHRVLIVEHGIYIIEVLDLEEVSAQGLTEFAFFLSPLKLKGATGSPVRPVAVVSHGQVEPA